MFELNEWKLHCGSIDPSLQGSPSNATAPVGSVISGSHVSAVMPIRTSQITSQNSTGLLNSTSPTIHSIALRVSLVLNDLYSSLLDIDVDFNKILKTKCRKE